MILYYKRIGRNCQMVFMDIADPFYVFMLKRKSVVSDLFQRKIVVFKE